MPPIAHLLVVDPGALDLDRVRLAASRHGWDVELQHLDGTPAVDGPPAPARADTGEPRFREALRLVVTARPGAPEPDAARLVTASAGLALDTTHRRPTA